MTVKRHAAIPYGRDPWELWLPRLPVLAFAALFAWHFWCVARSAVDVPFWDEWDALVPGGLSRDFPLGWILARQNDSFIIPTKLQIWVLYRLTGWNLAVHQVVNIALFGLLLAAVARLARRAEPGLSWGALCSFMLFMLSPVLNENHSWGIESCFHFSVLFFVLAADLLLLGEPSAGRLAAGALSAILSLYSYASGVVLVSVLLAALCASRLRRALAKDAGPGEAGRVALAAIAILAGLTLWAAGYDKPPGHPPPVWPVDWQFWRFFLNLVSFGFGMDQLSVTLGLFCLALVLAPLAAEIRRRGWRLEEGSWALLTVTVGVLATLASIAATRARFGLDWSKTSRYSELALLLVPFGALAWSRSLKGRPGPRAGALSWVWAVAFLGFADTWKFPVYEHIASERLKGLECLRERLRRGGPAACPTVYHHPLADKLETAQELELSFVRRIRQSP